MQNTLKVLIMDDDKTIQQVTASFVEQFASQHNNKASIEICTDSFDCVFQLNDRHRKYDVILLDILLPGIDGIGIFTSIEYSNPDYLKHVLFLTSTPKSIKDSFPNMKLNILEKPFSYEAFCLHMSNILHKEAQNPLPLMLKA